MFKLTIYLKSAAIHGFAANDSHIDEMYSRFGPTPRICFDYLRSKSQLEWHINLFQVAFSNLSSSILLNMVQGASRLKMDEVSETLFLLQRRDEWFRETVCWDPCVPSPGVR